MMLSHFRVGSPNDFPEDSFEPIPLDRIPHPSSHDDPDLGEFLFRNLSVEKGEKGSAHHGTGLLYPIVLMFFGDEKWDTLTYSSETVNR